MQGTNLSGQRGTNYLTVSLPGWLGVIGGVWLLVAPSILSYADITKPFYNDLIGGIVAIVLTGFCALFATTPATVLYRKIAGGLVALGGVWLILAPFILDYSGITNALWNDVITGAVFILMAGYSLIYHAVNFNAFDESY
jgi:SPW repeat